MVGENGFEPLKPKQQIYSLPPLTTRELLPIQLWAGGRLNQWSWWTDSNPRPADYKSAALPAELHQRIYCIALEQYTIRQKECQAFFLFYLRKKLFLLHQNFPAQVDSAAVLCYSDNRPVAQGILMKSGRFFTGRTAKDSVRGRWICSKPQVCKASVSPQEKGDRKEPWK